MTQSPAPISDVLQYYATSNYPCSYLAGHIARSQVVSPHADIRDAQYTYLIQRGFRRSGAYVYRPHCDHCQACTSIRVPVADYRPNRSQRRAWTQHAGLQTSVSAPRFSDEHYALYIRYQESRHSGGGMDQGDAEQYADFLLTSHVTTLMVEFREPGMGEQKGLLRMVSVIDQIGDGLSAVYTFYTPEPGLSLGTFNVMWQIELAKALDLKYLYLGYWIKDSAKMAYKTRFQPHELFRNGVWTTAQSHRSCRQDAFFTR